MRKTAHYFFLTIILSMLIVSPVYGETVSSNTSMDIVPNAETEVASNSVPSSIEDNLDATADAFPVTYDLRDQGYTIPIKDQGITNTCWAFSTLASVESSALANGLGLIDFSELYLVNYANQLHEGEGLQVTDSEGDTDPFNVIGDNGQYVASRLISWAGPVSSSSMSEEFPAFGSTVVASLDGVDEYSVESAAHVMNIDYLPSPATRDGNLNYTGYNETGTNAIKQAIQSGNAVSICLNAQADHFNLDTHASYVDDEDLLLDHTVAIIGWDDEYSASNFKDTPAGDGAWICRNSWGTDDGLTDEGYFYVSYYDKSLYNPMVLHAEAKSYTINHQYDQLNMLSVTTPTESDSNGVTANVFTAENAELVKAVAVYTAEPGSSVNVKVYLLGDEATSPDDGNLIAEQDATIEWAGYHTIPLEQEVSVASGKRFSVVATITNSEGEGYTPIEVGTSESQNGTTYQYVTAENEAGQSYIQTSEGWVDLKDYSIGSYTVGNALIKAFAVEDESAVEPEDDVTTDDGAEETSETTVEEDLDNSIGKLVDDDNNSSESKSDQDASSINDQNTDNTDAVNTDDKVTQEDETDEESLLDILESVPSDEDESDYSEAYDSYDGTDYDVYMMEVDDEEDSEEASESDEEDSEDVDEDVEDESSDSNAKASSTENPDIPDTGDSNTVLIWGGILAAAVIVLIVLFVRRRK